MGPQEFRTNLMKNLNIYLFIVSNPCSYDVKISAPLGNSDYILIKSSAGLPIPPTIEKFDSNLFGDYQWNNISTRNKNVSEFAVAFNESI